MARTRVWLTLAMMVIAGALPAQEPQARGRASVTYPKARARTSLKVKYDSARDVTTVVSQVLTSPGQWRNRPTVIDTDVAVVHRGRKPTEEIPIVTIQFTISVDVMAADAVETMPVEQFGTAWFLADDGTTTSYPARFVDASSRTASPIVTVRRRFHVELPRDDFVRLTQSRRVKGAIGPIEFQWLGGRAMDALRDVAAVLNPALISSTHDR